jgi:4-diphosphocytidyl-2-C-methyl-D-erythritol kinase
MEGQTPRQQTPPDRERAGAQRILLLSSDQPGLPADETNLVVRAAQAFADAIAASGAGDVAEGAAGQQRSLGRGQAGEASGGRAVLPHSAGSLDDRAAAGEGVDAPRANTDSMAGLEARVVGGEAAARVRPVAATLEKQIPLGAGLGGGSSDAARTLIALNRLWRVGWSPMQLATVAAKLGSDVPFFLHGPSSICTGRGEIVKPIGRPRRQKWVALVLPDVHMPTPAVYRRFDELRLGFNDEMMSDESRLEHWTELDSKDLLVGLVNDLEAPAFDISKDLGTLRSELELKLRRPVRMSGSGSSLFTLYDDADEASDAVRQVVNGFALHAHAVELTPDISDDVG